MMSFFRRSGPDAPDLRVLPPRDYDALIAWMNERPGPAAFVLGWLYRFGGTSYRYRSFYHLYVHGPDHDWDLAALVANGALVSFIQGTHEAGQQLGEALKEKKADILTLIGPDACVSGFTEGFLPPNRTPRVDLKQCIMSRHRDDPLPRIVQDDLALHKARAADVQDVIAASLLMHAEEIQGPNSASDIDALERSSVMKVKTGRCWIVRDASGALVFKASIALPSPAVAQIEGVWTAPSARGNKIAYRAMLQLCRHLHQRYPTLSLTVGNDNRPAIHVYEHLGFHWMGPWRTVYLV